MFTISHTFDDGRAAMDETITIPMEWTLLDETPLLARPGATYAQLSVPFSTFAPIPKFPFRVRPMQDGAGNINGFEFWTERDWFGNAYAFDRHFHLLVQLLDFVAKTSRYNP